MKYAQFFLRLAVAAAFFSAVADRFGYWGRPGQLNVVWGNWDNFATYTHQLTFFVGTGLSHVLAVIATLMEISLGLLLMLGYRTRFAALLAGMLMLVFALSMTWALGIKATFDYSVWVGAAACFLLSSLPAYQYSVDAYILKISRN